MKQTVYLFSNGELKRKDNTLFFETEKGRNYIPVENTKELYIFGEVTINKRVIEFLTENHIILHFFNYYEYYVGSFYPREHLNSGYILLKQVENYIDNNKRITIAKLIFQGAIQNIIKNLKYYNNREKLLNEVLKEISELLKKSENIDSISQLMGIEGNIREKYYNSFNTILQNDNFLFESRTKRPPKNKLNALISFGNSILYTTVLSEIYKTHLDPRIGYLHESNFRRFTLNLDIAEIFKPIIIDKIIFSLINKMMIKEEHFETILNGITLNEEGAKIFLREFEEKMKTSIKHHKMNRNVSYRELIRMELYKLQKHLIGEEEYKPYIHT
ncbi:MAG: type I-B CRISPR-associated endonuclease Cas1b [Candidatus Calescibacterium sp.]|nr:type I-B CRISPR-associated endonuclease Cas1b [Candidatus Calescibacterium sp.]MDW8133318.1 type I-B CRISPR-associated endonuclease Cas1b [Candidatus Calescibacterium sp.]